MELTTTDLDNGVTKVLLSGRMDIEGATAVDLRFSVLAGSKKKLLVDLSQVSFMASLGIRTLMMAAKAMANKGCKMVLAQPAAKRRESARDNRCKHCHPCRARYVGCLSHLRQLNQLECIVNQSRNGLSTVLILA